jgi:integrase
MTEVRPGVWYFRAHDPHHPKGHQARRTFRGNKTEAKRGLAAFVREVRDGGLATADGSLRDHIDRWLEFCRHRVGGRTYLNYKSKMERVKTDLGHISLAKFDKKGGQLLDRQYSSWLASGVSAATVKGIHEVLRNCLHQAEKWQLLDSVATDRATPPKHAKPPIRDISPAVVVQAVDEARRRSRAAHVPVAILFNSVTGVRAGELCAVRWPDFNPSTQVVRIDKAITQDSQRAWIVGPTKNSQMRDIPLELETVNLLLAWQSERKTACEAAGAQLDPDGYIFSPSPEGSRFWTPQSYGQALRRLNKAPCPECFYKKKPDPRCNTCHGSRRLELFELSQLEVRHFTATQLIAAGLDVVTVGGLMGHHPTVTLSNYAAWQRQGGRKAAAIIEKVVFGDDRETTPQVSDPVASNR